MDLNLTKISFKLKIELEIALFSYFKCITKIKMGVSWWCNG